MLGSADPRAFRKQRPATAAADADFFLCLEKIGLGNLRNAGALAASRAALALMTGELLAYAEPPSHAVPAARQLIASRPEMPALDK